MVCRGFDEFLWSYDTKHTPKTVKNLCPKWDSEYVNYNTTKKKSLELVFFLIFIDKHDE